MISTKVRLQLEDIATRIAGGVSVTLEEMTLIQKWADRHTTVASMLRKARRKASAQDIVEGSLDDFLNKMDLGDPDPQSHLTSESSPEDLYNFFRRDDGESDWRQHD